VSARWHQFAVLCGFYGRMLGRTPGLWWGTGLAAAAMGSGGIWRSFNFGGAEAEFLLSFGIGLQNLAGMVLTVGAALQVWNRDLIDGILPVWKARGVSSAAIAGARLMVLACYSAVFTMMSAAVIMVMLGWLGHTIALGDLLATSILIWLKLVLVAAIAVWMGSWSRSVVFVLAATAALVLLGHMRPWAIEAGSIARGFSWLAPDLNALTPRTGKYDEMGHELTGLGLMAVAYVGGYGFLASRALQRRRD